jgi:hypothetical protein
VLVRSNSSGTGKLFYQALRQVAMGKARSLRLPCEELPSTNQPVHVTLAQIEASRRRGVVRTLTGDVGTTTDVNSGLRYSHRLKCYTSYTTASTTLISLQHGCKHDYISHHSGTC